MRLLSVECSSLSAGAALLEDGKLLAAMDLETKLNHSCTLMSMVQSVLDAAQLKLEDVDRCACSAGPGSFTGLRIAMAAVKGICLARDLPVQQISSLETLCYNVPTFTGRIVTAVDACCNQIYTADFRFEQGELRRLCEDHVEDRAEKVNALLKLEENVILLGDAAEACFAEAKGAVHITLAPPQLRLQKAGALALAAWASRDTLRTAAELAPVYLRLPQAERERLARLGQKVQ